MIKPVISTGLGEFKLGTEGRGGGGGGGAWHFRANLNIILLTHDFFSWTPTTAWSFPKYPTTNYALNTVVQFFLMAGVPLSPLRY